MGVDRCTSNRVTSNTVEIGVRVLGFRVAVGVVVTMANHGVSIEKLVVTSKRIMSHSFTLDDTEL